VSNLERRVIVLLQEIALLGERGDDARDPRKLDRGTAEVACQAEHADASGQDREASLL
jgi:hypothetical protein